MLILCRTWNVNMFRAALLLTVICCVTCTSLSIRSVFADHADEHHKDEHHVDANHANEHHGDGHHAGDHHGDEQHKDEHPADDHHGDGHHNDSVHHEDGHHADDHNGDGHHADDHHADGHHNDSVHHEDGHHADDHHADGHHNDSDHHAGDHHADDHHGDKDHDKDDHHFEKEICELQKEVLVLKEKIAHQDVEIEKQNTAIQAQNTKFAENKIKALKLTARIEHLEEDDARHEKEIKQLEHKDDDHHQEEHHDEPGWVDHGGHHYLFNDTAVTWREALDWCHHKHAELAEPDEIDEDNFLGAESVKRSKQYWIGGTDLLSDGTWHWWSNNHAFSHTHWLDGEPNNGGANHVSDEDCIIYNWSGLGKWADAPCTWKRPFICQK